MLESYLQVVSWSTKKEFFLLCCLFWGHFLEEEACRGERESMRGGKARWRDEAEEWQLGNSAVQRLIDKNDGKFFQR
jgi:hypothetical protein